MLLLRALPNQLCFSILIGISTLALLRALARAALTGLMLLISTRKGTLCDRARTACRITITLQLLYPLSGSPSAKHTIHIYYDMDLAVQKQ
jgi:hypothetical protein